MDTSTKTILIIAGVGVAGYLIWKTLGKNISKTGDDVNTITKTIADDFSLLNIKSDVAGIINYLNGLKTGNNTTTNNYVTNNPPPSGPGYYIPNSSGSGYNKITPPKTNADAYNIGNPIPGITGQTGFLLPSLANKINLIANTPQQTKIKSIIAL